MNKTIMLTVHRGREERPRGAAAELVSADACDQLSSIARSPRVSGSLGAASASSISRRATNIRQSPPGVFLQTPPQKATNGGRRGFQDADQVRVALNHRRQSLGDRHSKRSPTGEHFVEPHPNAQISLRLSAARPSPAPGSCKPRCRAARPRPSSPPERCAASSEAAFARPKSRTFTTPSGVTLILEASDRWMMLFSCAPRARPPLAAQSSRFRWRYGSARDAVSQRLAVDPFEHQGPHPINVFQSVDRADMWMIE